MRNWVREHRNLSIAGAFLALALAVFVIVWFEPQKLFIDERVDEDLAGFESAAAAVTTPAPTTSTVPPTTVAVPPQDADSTTTTSTTTSTTSTTTTAPAGPVVLHQSELQSPGKAGSGDVFLVELEDGSRVIRFENLDVSNGPDLRVILSPSGLVDDRDAYHLDGFYDLGELRGNQGNQNYEVPDDVDLSEYSTVAIFCIRFNYTFNAATIS
jgi:hypothetical protein